MTNEQERKALELQQFLNENGYLHPKLLHTGEIGCVMPLLFTGAIITLNLKNYQYFYTNRWYYHSVEAAKKALGKWLEGDEPLGWHRHPDTGKRRDDGDLLKEYINR